LGTSVQDSLQLNQTSQLQGRIIDHWTFGGSTAMMLQINHRESHDVDLFLNDAQLLPFLDPKNHDFAFEIAPSDYAGDGISFIKMPFDGIGEIDFIVRQALTDAPTIERDIEGERTLLETIPEIITKKIVNRGASIKPQQHADAIIAALRRYPDAVNVTLRKLNELNRNS
jgi:hypothetical protein